MQISGTHLRTRLVPYWCAVWWIKRSRVAFGSCDWALLSFFNPFYTVAIAMLTNLNLYHHYATETGDLVCKFGMHSGQVLAGVLRGEKSKFSLFGETVIKAAKMESCGVPNKIQVSSETCELLRDAGLGNWLIPREDSVLINGQPTQTFFLHITRELRLTTITEDVLALSTTKEDRLRRLVDWNVEVLRDLIKNIVARRQALFEVASDTDSISTSASRRSVGAHYTPGSSAQSFRRKISRPPEMPLEEVTDVLMLPDFDVVAARKQVDPKSIELDPLVVDQLKSLVTRIASMYR